MQKISILFFFSQTKKQKEKMLDKTFSTSFNKYMQTIKGFLSMREMKYFIMWEPECSTWTWVHLQLRFNKWVTYVSDQNFIWDPIIYEILSMHQMPHPQSCRIWQTMLHLPVPYVFPHWVVQISNSWH